MCISKQYIIYKYISIILIIYIYDLKNFSFKHWKNNVILTELF